MRQWIFIFSLLFSSFSFSSQKECRRFYYRVYQKQDHYGIRTFEVNLEKLKSQFENMKDDTDDIKLKKIMTSDIRITFFKLQSLSRIYEQIYSDSFFTSKRELFKNYEDLIGKVDLWQTMWDLAIKIEEPELAYHFQNLRDSAAENMLNSMSGILENPNLFFKSQFKEIKKFSHWKKSKADFKAQHESVASDLRKLAEDVKARKYTQDDIEQGLHELRRKLRWPLIHLQTFNRLTKYDRKIELPRKIRKYLANLETTNPKLMESGYLEMAPTDIDKPLVVPFIPHAMTTELVSFIGKRKDKAEGDIYFDRAMKALGFSAQRVSMVESKLLKATDRTEKIDHKELSDKIQADLEASGLLEFYADALEKLN